MAAALTACLVAAIFAVALPLGAASATTARNGELVADGAWCWFQDPRAVHYHDAHDRTYVGYVTSTGDIDVIAQDAHTALLTHSVLHPAFQADDHAAPGLVVLPDGRIAVFYSGHAGSRMYYRISSHSEDITAFGPELTVPTNTPGPKGYTYANPIYLPAEHRLYLFFRGGDYLPTMTWTTDYVHWATAVDVVVPDQLSGQSRPYAKYATNNVDTIAITFTDGHPREVPSNSVYAAIYKAGVLRAPDGTLLSVLDPTAPHYDSAGDVAVPHTGAVHTDWLRPSPESPDGNGGLVYDDTGADGPGWVESMALDSSGAPTIVYSTYADPANAPYYYAHWNGLGWTESKIVDAGGTISVDGDEPQYSGGADIDRSDPGTVYLSRDVAPGDGQWEIERWHTADGGASFGQPDAVTTHSVLKNVRPVVPWGAPGEISVLWMSGTYAFYSSAYATQLRELTTGLAPTTARISASSLAINAGSSVTIGGRIEQGYEGQPVPAADVQLLGHTNGEPDQILRTGRADLNGLIHFVVTPSDTMRFTVRAPASPAWGSSTSPSVVVHVAKPSAVRISASATSVKAGKPVVFGIRAVDSRSGAYLPGVSVELWQQPVNSYWRRLGRYVTDASGLVHVTRSTTGTATYQGRLVPSLEHQAASSSTIVVLVT
jgi:hypothetical protein